MSLCNSRKSNVIRAGLDFDTCAVYSVILNTHNRACQFYSWFPSKYKCVLFLKQAYLIQKGCKLCSKTRYLTGLSRQIVRHLIWILIQHITGVANQNSNCPVGRERDPTSTRRAFNRRPSYCLWCILSPGDRLPRPPPTNFLYSQYMNRNVA